MEMRNNRKETALITGASGGIGLELARLMAAKGHPLVLVARNEVKLRALKSELEKAYGLPVHILPLDLAQAGATKSLFETCRYLGLHIDLLINNAGFGDQGHFLDTDRNREQEMIALNIAALTDLCKIFAPAMDRQGYGRILNVASTAAFQPGPSMAVYFATKAYVLHFSEALAVELRSSGITVTALCPGPTQSGFAAAANMEQSLAFKSKRLPTAAEVAAYGYRAMMKGKRVAIHGWINNLLVLSLRMAPRQLAAAVTGWVIRKTA